MRALSAGPATEPWLNDKSNGYSNISTSIPARPLVPRGNAHYLHFLLAYNIEIIFLVGHQRDVSVSEGYQNIMKDSCCQHEDTKVCQQGTRNIWLKQLWIILCKRNTGRKVHRHRKMQVRQCESRWKSKPFMWKNKCNMPTDQSDQSDWAQAKKFF